MKAWAERAIMRAKASGFDAFQDGSDQPVYVFVEVARDQWQVVARVTSLDSSELDRAEELWA